MYSPILYIVLYIYTYKSITGDKKLLYIYKSITGDKKRHYIMTNVQFLRKI